ncbi:DNA-binding protein [Allostreptomyces psammosilenae]|uniref:DNA-binding protein n=1 Tax=Allostreptomyces psammosilenae TaxID=1892865 RepID=A0A852ZQ40_9ACTN|nr:DNA-binding protein [Allostreptomyces psammosilenae]NYI04489.1 hypothetical protein [Allostreptomyces psammosilenae]
MTNHETTDERVPAEPFAAPDPEQARAARRYQALARITERHGDADERRLWEERGIPLGPLDAWRRVAHLAAGAAIPDEGRPSVDATDIAAALTLVHQARAEVDQLEIGLLEMARGRGLTWQQIAYSLGLGTAQAARQRHQRLTGRADSDEAGTAD